MKLNATDLKNLILTLVQDIVFHYDGVTGCISPWNATRIDMSYGDFFKKYSDVDSLMSDTIFNGKSLNEIADEIEIE